MGTCLEKRQIARLPGRKIYVTNFDCVRLADDGIMQFIVSSIKRMSSYTLWFVAHLSEALTVLPLLENATNNRRIMLDNVKLIS